MSDRLSYLDDSALTGVRQAFDRLFATLLAWDGTDIRLWRDDVAVTPEPIRSLIEPANRQSRSVNDAGPLDLSLSGGTITAWAPWDVERGDQFRYGTATAVIRDVLPADDGIQAATFEVMDGGGST